MHSGKPTAPPQGPRALGERPLAFWFPGAADGRNAWGARVTCPFLDASVPDSQTEESVLDRVAGHLCGPPGVGAPPLQPARAPHVVQQTPRVCAVPRGGRPPCVAIQIVKTQ